MSDPSSVSDKSMSIEEALSRPDEFVKGMEEQTTYNLFVPIPPFTLRAMLGQTPEVIEPFEYGGKSGSLVTVTDRERWIKLCERFQPKKEE